jgi:Na+/melibiose symporter-like transporter
MRFDVGFIVIARGEIFNRPLDRPMRFDVGLIVIARGEIFNRTLDRALDWPVSLDVDVYVLWAIRLVRHFLLLPFGAYARFCPTRPGGRSKSSLPDFKFARSDEMLPTVRGLRKRVEDTGAAFAAVARNANLRWLELAWTCSIIGHYAFLIAVSVYAYNVGGEKAVGLIFLARLIPAALIAPFAGLLGDRFRKDRVLLTTNSIRIVLVGAAASAVFLDTSSTVVYAFSIAATIATTPVRSSQAALTPALARTPTELTAANAVASGVESIAFFLGPALAGVLLGVASTGLVFALTALMLVASTFFIVLIRIEHVPRPKREIEASTILSEAFAGFTTIARHRALRVMMVLLTAQTAIVGAVQVFIVVSAIELLDLGDGGVGYLNSAIGVGAFVGAVGALALAGSQRLSTPFMAGVVLMGLPLVAIGIWPNAGVAVAVLAVLGVGSSLVDVSGLTLVQRAVPDDVMARVFGVIQMLWLASIGIGAALVPPLIAWLGLEGALIATGAVLPVLVVVLARRVAQIDAAAPPPEASELRILASVPIFAPLPGGSLEHLAGRLVPLRVEPDTTIVREGDAGDRFYIVTEGEVDVLQDGAKLTELGPGGYFGEIALIRDVPRTATVVARTPAVLYALDRDDFLAAVTGHPQASEAAETVMSARLAGPAATGYRSTASY